MCNNTYHTSYYNTADGEQYFYPCDESQQYFQTTAQTVFETELLKQLTAQITFNACTFQSQAEVYNTIHGHCDQQRLSTFVSRFRRSNIHKHADGLDWRLNVTRLEDGWFLHRVVLTFAELGLLNNQNFAAYNDGNRRDIEGLCERAMLTISTSPPRWVKHSCKVPGCKEGMVTIDGNEKLTRTMCAAPKSKVKCPLNHVNFTQCCSHSPVTGGRHQSSSRYCKDHQEMVVDASPCTSMTAPLTVSIPTSVLHNPVLTCANFGTLPDNDSAELLQGCRKQHNVNRYLDRTAGVATIVRPCGIVVNFMEMFTCESPTQMYVFIAFTFAHGRDISRVKFVAYDRACDLQPLLCNLEKKKSIPSWIYS